MMTLAIDGTPLFRDKIDGVGRYTFEITKRLADDYKLVVIGFSDDKNKPIPIRHRNISYEYLPIKRRLYGLSHKVKVGVPINRYIKNKIDFVLYFNFVNTPYIKNVPYAVVVHDLAYIKYPDTVSNRNRKYLKRRIPGSINNAEFVIAVSENTKRDVLEQYKRTENDIIVVPNGIDSEVYSKTTEQDVMLVKSKYSLPEDYILFLGSIEPRKNLLNVLEAYELLGKDALPLVIAGPAGWNNKNINERILSLQQSGYKIITPGYIDNDSIPAIYKGSRIFIFPSLYEGFGIPILEAMASGVPVITSNIPPMSDIVLKPEARIEPKSPKQIKDAIIQISTDSDLRQILINSGYSQVKIYSWDKASKYLSKELALRV